MKHAGLLIFLIILVAFVAILWATSLVGDTFGSAGELIGLVAVAVVLLIGYIKSKRGDK